MSFVAKGREALGALPGQSETDRSDEGLESPCFEF